MNELSATRQAFDRLLVGKRLLIVESDFFIAGLMSDDLTEAGAHVLGPVESAAEAMPYLEGEAKPDGAILDVDLQDESVLDLAVLLKREAVAVALSSILSSDLLHAKVRATPLLHKAAEPWEISRALFGLDARVMPDTGDGRPN